jgi:SAM-dependent methyltransferase
MQQSWWDDNLTESDLVWFCEQLGSIDHGTRITVRNFLKSIGKVSLLDLACGPCIEYEGYKRDGMKVDYTGVDSSNLLLEKARIRNPEIRVINSDLETDFEDGIFDVVLARHILEHQEDFTRVIKEAARLSNRYVIVVTFREGEKTIINPIMLRNGLVHDNTVGSQDLRNSFEANKLNIKERIILGNNTVYIMEKKC